MQQNDSDRTGHRQQKNNIKIGNVQNGKNTLYNTDNYVMMYILQHLLAFVNIR